MDWRAQLIEQIRGRALLYATLYDTLAGELGAADAERLLATAIRARGEQGGAGLSRHAPADFGGLRDSFLKGVPGEGALFAPEVERCDRGGLEIRFHACPLKDAWHDAGLSEERIATLCRIAGAVDRGMFEAAGFAIENRTWTPGAPGCCHLSVRRA